MCVFQGRVPIMVNATAGSTVLGSYDQLDALADVCAEHSIWLHVDGAWGGAVLLSDRLRDKMRGIERFVQFAPLVQQSPGAV